MKTLALLLAWIPLTMAFMVNGPGGAVCVFYSLLMLAVCIEICTAYYTVADWQSRGAIARQYGERWQKAIDANDFDAARECLHSQQMFINRGAA